MNINEFDFVLPESLIAQRPTENRTDSRLVFAESAGNQEVYRHAPFAKILQLLKPGDVLVVNDTRVIPARIAAEKPTGGRVEMLLERVLDDHTALVQLKSNKTLKSGQKLMIGQQNCEIRGRQDRFYVVVFAPQVNIIELFEAKGSIPLPPYIKRPVESGDCDRYQTVFAERAGAVAAPTAGLHFDEPLIRKIRDKGIDIQFITLHVGAGTFLPVQSDDVDKHVMHSEWVQVSESCCHAISDAKARGRKVVAVGTTVVRSLESAAASGRMKPYEGDTRLFIKPGFEFSVVDRMVTNFHLPKSTLLMLVSAFAGYEKVMQMYQYAISEQLRFFSYGDAMWLERSE